MNGRHSISIAVLSGNQDDVAIIDSTLRDAGHAAHCHWVKSPKNLSDALEQAPVELIIVNCDQYPESIREVIGQKDRFDPEVPVIALRREVDESLIESAMRDGACDLVSIALKKRLQSVVGRELRALRVERALNSTLRSATEYRRQIKDHMRSSKDAIAVVQEGIVVESNEAWLKLFKAANADEVEGMPLMDSFDAESHSAVKGALIASLEGKWQKGEKLAAKPVHEAGEGIEFQVGFSTMDYDGAPGVQLRIDAQDRVVQEPTALVHNALKRDPTTLFFHRAQFIERLKKRLSRKPSSGLHVLAYIKPDNFTEARERVGILDSEELLGLFAEEVRKRLHPRDLAGRFEGTSVMVLLERGNSRDAQVWGSQLVEHIRRKTFEVGQTSTNLSCTVGICRVSDVFHDLEELVAATLETYDSGKKAGGDTAYLNDAADEDTKQRQFDAIWVKHLKAALMEERFRLAQLPIAGLRSDSVDMYDLLVRMIDEQGNPVLPSEFLPAAERNNLMKNIDRWMYKAAIEFCNDNKADRVFVRMSTQSILDPNTMAWMEQEFDKSSFDCSRLVTQVPEQEASKHIKQTRTIAEKLRRLGVGFAIEHYGTDQERFQILDLLKPDYIKIDGELMHTLITDKQMQESVEKIVRAAEERNIKTIAERVENANAMAVLFQLGLDFMQGYYVREPEVVLADTSENVERRTLAEVVGSSN